MSKRQNLAKCLIDFISCPSSQSGQKFMSLGAFNMPWPQFAMVCKHTQITSSISDVFGKKREVTCRPKRIGPFRQYLPNLAN